MTPERFRQIRNLFDAAVERQTEARPVFLQEACQGDHDLHDAVGHLLAMHQQTEGILEQVPSPVLLRGDAGRMEGRRIDHYEILRELGRGGMGSVYLAMRTDQVYRHPVAFKVVRPEAGSEDVIRRFHQEREIVAGLDHPNIARLLDGGTTPEGLPYFVMEYVDGQPIDVYCDQRQLSVEDRLKLFRAVCAALEYAHGRGVAHRDLKPGNILVTAEGSVKLLDFGIAKLLDAQPEAVAPLTRTGLRPMTPEYASPEQVKGESVGAASDQYSLGVVLYEMLTGHRPYRMRSRLIHEVVRVICEEDPTTPSTAVTETVERTIGEKPVPITPQLVSRCRETTPAELRRDLSGDLDNILLRVLRKDPQQRYGSVKNFSEDLQRRLDGQPVMAQGQSLLYRAGKFLKRHAGWAVAAAVVVIGLATGAVEISVYGIAFLVFCITCFAATFFLVRFEAGPGVARHLIFSGYLVFLTLFAFAIMMATIVQTNLMQKYIEAILHLTLPPAILWFCFMLLRWPWRDKWAGKVLMDLSRPSRLAGMLVRFGAGCALAWTVVASLYHWRSESSWRFDATLMVALTVSASILMFWQKVEIRERGILYFGQLTRWRKIETFCWVRPQERFVILKIGFKGVWGSWKIPLPADCQPEAEAILRKQLPEWPGGTAAPAEPSPTQ